MTTRSASFDGRLICAIDEALNSLGQSVRQAVYFYVEEQFGVTRNEIPCNLQQFQKGLKGILGADGRDIERLIMNKLATKNGLPIIIGKSGQVEFIEYVNAAKQEYVRNVTKQTLKTEADAPSFF